MNLLSSSEQLISGKDHSETFSYSKTDSQKACAALVVLSYPSFDVLYEDYEIDTTEYPYIPGFLAFKEIPSLTILFNRLKEKSPEFWPQVLLVDGNGKCRADP